MPDREKIALGLIVKVVEKPEEIAGELDRAQRNADNLLERSTAMNGSRTAAERVASDKSIKASLTRVNKLKKFDELRRVRWELLGMRIPLISDF